MALRDRLKRLERRAEGSPLAVPQPDGTVKRFPERQLAEAFMDALDRSLGRKGLAGDPDSEARSEAGEHPLSAAARNSSDPRWRESGYWANKPEHEIADLSE